MVASEWLQCRSVRAILTEAAEVRSLGRHACPKQRTGLCALALRGGGAYDRNMLPPGALLQGRVAVVTGSTRGLGYAMARELGTAPSARVSELLEPLTRS